MCDFWQDALPRSRRPSDQHLTKTTFFDGMSPQLVIQGEFGCEGRISSVHRPSPPPPCVSVARFLPPRPSRLCVSMARERVSCSTFPPPAPLPLNENTSQGVPSQMRVKSLAAGIINGVAAALSGVSWRDPRGGQPLVGFRGAIVCAGADPPRREQWLPRATLACGRRGRWRSSLEIVGIVVGGVVETLLIEVRRASPEPRGTPPRDRSTRASCRGRAR